MSKSSILPSWLCFDKSDYYLYSKSSILPSWFHFDKSTKIHQNRQTMNIHSFWQNFIKSAIFITACISGHKWIFQSVEALKDFDVVSYIRNEPCTAQMWDISLVWNFKFTLNCLLWQSNWCSNSLSPITMIADWWNREARAIWCC